MKYYILKIKYHILPTFFKRVRESRPATEDTELAPWISRNYIPCVKRQ